MLKKVDDEEVLQRYKDNIIDQDSVELPLKPHEDAPKSNMNVSFGKGRENTSTKMVRHRAWYEAEIIVSKSITDLPWYPKAGDSSIIQVITDDGYKFECKISGQNNKNLRSAGDLTTLGKWLKGRLINTGVLKFGDFVTQDVLKKYGRCNVRMSKTEIDNTYYLDFGIK